MTFVAPEPLASHHDVKNFHSGNEMLDAWLKRRALKNQVSGASRTFVACGEGRVVAYYALSSGAVRTILTPGRFRRNMPDPIPVALLARLAVDQSVQGRGFGRALVQDAARRIVRAADVIGIRGLIIHALSVEAKNFYQQLGFEPSMQEPMLLMATLQDIEASLR